LNEETKQPEDRNDDRPDDEDPDDATIRRLAEVLGPDAPESAEGSGATEALFQGGRIRLDKTGALVGLPKRQPVKPYAREGAAAEAPTEEPDVREGAAPAKAVIPPPIGTVHPGVEGVPFEASSRPDDEVAIRAGRFLYGEDQAPTEVPPFLIDRYPVTHREYAEFVRATGHRRPLYWVGVTPPEELLDHPVVGVDYFDALAYARWRGKDLPFEDEWERAARSTDGRTYPWGNEQGSDANTARLGLKMTLPIGWHELNVTPEGVRDMVGNVWEMTHSPAPGGGIVVRGGSWYDFALYAKTWFRFASRVEARNGTIGFRCVRREAPRADAPREIAPEDVDAQILARRGEGPEADPSAWSAEKRDLVPDVRRLRHLVADRASERSQAAAAPPPPPKPPPKKAAVPPPIRVPAPEAPVPVKEEGVPVPPPREAPPEPTPAPPPSPEAPGPATERVPAASVAASAAPGPSAPGIGATPGVDRPAPVPAPARPKRPPTDSRHSWMVIGTGLVLSLALLALLLVKVLGGGEEPAPPPVAERPPPEPDGSLVPGLPPVPSADPRDDAEPTWIDGGAARWTDALREGVWLVVFAEAEGEEASITAETVDGLHRRLRGQSARIVLVLPRRAFEDEEGDLLEPGARRDRLRVLGATTDLTVLLDADGVGARARLDVRQPTAAVVLVDGTERHRTTPLEGGFTLFSIAPLAARALEIRPSGD
jgi:formylglycine-generating enzyme required for sulfatase activity